MAVVYVPHYSPWVVARWAFRQLMEQASKHVCLAEDEYAVKQAIALDGLQIDMLEEDQQVRLARAVALSADELRFKIERGRLELPDGEGFKEALALLEMRMHDLLDDPTDTPA